MSASSYAPELLRLRMLLTHMQAHDHDHESAIAHHAEALGSSFPPECRALLHQAIEDGQRAKRSLSALLEALGGPLTP